jgi:hypothetical protein
MWCTTAVLFFHAIVEPEAACTGFGLNAALPDVPTIFTVTAAAGGVAAGVVDDGADGVAVAELPPPPHPTVERAAVARTMMIAKKLGVCWSFEMFMTIPEARPMPEARVENRKNS